MVFREEQPHAPWATYEWMAWGHPQITALYSPWQVLYIDDVLERCNETLPLSVLEWILFRGQSVRQTVSTPRRREW